MDDIGAIIVASSAAAEEDEARRRRFGLDETAECFECGSLLGIGEDHEPDCPEDET